MDQRKPAQGEVLAVCIGTLHARDPTAPLHIQAGPGACVDLCHALSHSSNQRVWRLPHHLRWQWRQQEQARKLS